MGGEGEEEGGEDVRRGVCWRRQVIRGVGDGEMGCTFMGRDVGVEGVVIGIEGGSL